MIRNFLIASAALACVWATAVGQPVTRFRLPSGVTCYVADTASAGFSYYLIQNGGNAMDTQHELGMSHLVEHLSFISSEHFPGGGIGRFLKYYDIANNASTYQDKIVYYMTDVPASSPAADSCLLVLRDWCGGLTPDDTELRREVGVITEEWRSGRRIDRNQAEFARLLYNDTNYARLSGLGNVEDLRGLTADSVRRFIARTFDPERCAIVVKGPVGDVKRLKDRVGVLFADVKRHDGFQSREQVVIPANDSVYFLRIAKPDAMPATILVNMRMTDNLRRDAEGFCRDRFYVYLYNHFMARRLARYGEQSDCRIYDCKIRMADLVKGYFQLQIELTTAPGSELQQLRRVMSLHHDLLDNGLTDDERRELREGVAYGFAPATARKNSVQIVEDNFLRGYPIVEAEFAAGVAGKLAADFPNADFTEFCRRVISDRNTVVVAQNGPRYDRILTRQALLAAVTARETLPELPAAKSVGLVMPETDRKTRITDARPIAGCDGAVMWRLSNGVGVVFRPEKTGTVRIAGYCRGGSSGFSEIDMPVIGALVPVAENAGAGEYSASEIESCKFANNIMLERRVGGDDRTVTVTAPADRAAQAFSLLWMTAVRNRIGQMPQARVERAALQAAIGNQTAVDEYKTMLDRELFGLRPTMRRLSSDKLRELTPERLAAMYGRLFNDATGWVYIITGDISAETAGELAVRYLASLPVSGIKPAKIVPMKLLPQENVVKTIVYNTPDDNGGTDFSYVCPQQFLGHDAACFEVFAKVLRNRIVHTLREERGVIYGLYVEAYTRHSPSPLSIVNVNFGSSKSQQEPSAAYIDQEIRKIAAHGVTQDEVDAARRMFDANAFGRQKFEEQCARLWMSGQSERMERMLPADLQQVTPAEVGAIASVFSKESISVRFVFK